MTTRVWPRREFLWRLSQSALGSLILAQACDQVIPGQSKSTSVLVLGAGLSGLYTALLLEAKGLSVTVLEARDRVGGRIYTLTGIPGKPDVGGQIFTEKYHRLLNLANSLQVAVEPAKVSERKILLNIRGQAVLPQNWATSTANRLTKNEHSIIPSHLLAHYLRSYNILENATAWIKPNHFSLDIPLDKYLKTRGASTEALRLISCDSGSRTNSLKTTSTLWALRNDLRSKFPSKRLAHVRGGNSYLPEKMAAFLLSPVQTHKVVQAIYSNDVGVEVRCSDGSKYQADYAVVTLPFSVLRRVNITPPLQGLQAEAVQELPYTAVTQICLKIRAPFWENDGYPPKMWTDSLLESVLPIRDATGRIQSLVCWATGTRAKKLDALNLEAVKKLVISELSRVRPATTGNVEIERVVSWGNDPFSRGAYSYFAPGQIRRFQHQMAKPWQRIHFAGEHTAIATPGMESALESAERVTQEILERISDGSGLKNHLVY